MIIEKKNHLDWWSVSANTESSHLNDRGFTPGIHERLQILVQSALCSDLNMLTGRQFGIAQSVVQGTARARLPEFPDTQRIAR